MVLIQKTSYRKNICFPLECFKTLVSKPAPEGFGAKLPPGVGLDIPKSPLLQFASFTAGGDRDH